LAHHSCALVRSLKSPSCCSLMRVFYFAACAVKLVVESLRLPLETGHVITRVGFALAVFGFDNNAPIIIPSVGLVFKLTKEPDLGTAFSVFAFGALL